MPGNNFCNRRRIGIIEYYEFPAESVIQQIPVTEFAQDLHMRFKDRAIGGRGDKTAAAKGWADQIAGMDELRAAVDTLESLVPADLWPMPRYEEMLFL